MQLDEGLTKFKCATIAEAEMAAGAGAKDVLIAYPIYREGYERHFELQDEWAGNLDRVLTFGRQGLFAHDNTHHALAMAYGAVDCLNANGNFDNEKWFAYRGEFEKHVVED